MKLIHLGIAALAAALATSSMGQSTDAATSTPQSTLKVNSRAVLVDVVVTDSKGNPVKGLKQDDFKVLEQGKPQNVGYFEEHGADSLARSGENRAFPQLPPNVFTNFSPLPTPPAVNVLLLDALNTPMNDQMYLKKAAQRYLKTLKPGTRLAIFTMSMRLSFIQGFSDDPAVLATAMGYRKNDKSEPAILLQSQGESDAQNTVVEMMVAMEQAGGNNIVFTVPPQTIEAFQQFMQETRYAQDSDREYRTLQNLNQLAAFLGSFPGRKNVIWMSGAFPVELFGQTSMRFDDSINQTINLLSAARVAIYPVDVRGTNVPTYYTAENSLDPTITSAPQLLGPPPGVTADAPNAGQGGFAGGLQDESQAKNSSNSAMDMLASLTGGKAFYNQNDLSGIIGKVSDHSSDFYTISYSPTNSKMDGGFRKIEVKIGDGEHYALSYRRGYFARDQDLPGAAQTRQDQAEQQASQNPTRIDPLEPFMVFGMPQSEQILYKTLIQPMPQKADARPSLKGPTDRYSVDFALDLDDLHLKLAPDGSRKGKLNLSMILYDRYGQVTSREDHLVDLSIKPDVYPVFQKTGVQMHGEIQVPKGQYWLRTGVYDQVSRKVGTMEIPLSSVKESVASK
ncbi:MAG TPA: VWA domain-containing protein [Terracidiphilus sp.]|nr:VWA domain-containing protein [Terracidiphilus sp.]